jgi:SH3-like domain-containing protein
MKNLAVIFFTFVLLFYVSAYADDAETEMVAGTEEKAVPGFRTTALSLPRFVSLRSDKVYARTGPALRYPIKWVYQREKMPVEVIQEYDSWRKARDVGGEEGWIHNSLLTGERTVIVRAENMIPMREGFSRNARLVAHVEPEVIALIKKCTDGWCKIEAGGYSGWVERNFLWGIYEDEFLD